MRKLKQSWEVNGQPGAEARAANMGIATNDFKYDMVCLLRFKYGFRQISKIHPRRTTNCKWCDKRL